jgi:serine/threonine-protein kinase HipA
MKIFYENREVAQINPSEAGATLTYADAWRDLRGAFPISTRMPFTAKTYGSREVLPWLTNLLPESQQLEMVARVTGASQADPLALLANIGRDTSGALSFSDRGMTRMTARPVPDEAALERIIEELPKSHSWSAKMVSRCPSPVFSRRSACILMMRAQSRSPSMAHHRHGF